MYRRKPKLKTRLRVKRVSTRQSPRFKSRKPHRSKKPVSKAANQVKSVARKRAGRLRKSSTDRKSKASGTEKKRFRRGEVQDPRLEIAVREMNRGSSLTEAARSVSISPKELRSFVAERGLAKRKGDRWTIKDNRLRRVPVMTKGRVRTLTVRGYNQASLVGEHHQAVGHFVRTNNLKLISPFRGRTVVAVSGRKYPLETDPNQLHRIAAMDTPPFHEIYEITSTR
jgi:hypothetical protein